MKLERFCLIIEESTYLVNSGRVELIHIKYQEEDDDEEELAEALEEIIEYVRTIAMLFYTHFNDDAQEIKPILH